MAQLYPKIDNSIRRDLIIYDLNIHENASLYNVLWRSKLKESLYDNLSCLFPFRTFAIPRGTCTDSYYSMFVFYNPKFVPNLQFVIAKI
jgi:hypothetical protein